MVLTTDMTDMTYVPQMMKFLLEASVSNTCQDGMVLILVRCQDDMVLIPREMSRWYGFDTREMSRWYGFDPS